MRASVHSGECMRVYMTACVVPCFAKKKTIHRYTELACDKIVRRVVVRLTHQSSNHRFDASVSHLRRNILQWEATFLSTARRRLGLSEVLIGVECTCVRS